MYVDAVIIKIVRLPFHLGNQFESLHGFGDVVAFADIRGPMPFAGEGRVGIDDCGTSGVRVGNADLIRKFVPEGAIVRIRTAEMTVRDVVDVGVQTDAGIPSLSHNGLIHRLIHTEAFERGADSDKARTGILHSLAQPGLVLVEIPFDFGHSAEVAKVAPDEILAVEAFGTLPNLGEIAEVVEYGHTALRHRRQIGLDVLISPMGFIGIEEPAHLQPYCFRVHSRH